MGKIHIPTLQEVLATVPKDTEELRELEKRLRPSMAYHGSSEGFMGYNENLRDILAEDHNQLISLGRSYSEIADQITYLMDVKKMGRVGNYKFGGEIICGEQQCPWKDGQTCNQYVMWLVPDNGKDGFEPGEVYDTPNTLEISGLMPHLIKDHYFFEGQQSRYRIDPKDICERIFGEVSSFKDESIGGRR